MHKILISIKPEYVKLIMSGDKLYEYRKRLPKDIQIAVIYATAPTKKVVGEIQIKDVLSMTPKDLWDQTSIQSGLTPEKFFKYFDGVSIAYALSIKKVIEFENPIDLSALGLSRPPQSWQYI